MGTATPERVLKRYKHRAATEALVLALRDDLLEHGRALVEDLRNCDRAQYARLCAALLPRDLDEWVFQDIWEEQCADTRQMLAEAQRAGGEGAPGAQARTATLQAKET
jgi:hypothetical protein